MGEGDDSVAGPTLTFPSLTTFRVVGEDVPHFEDRLRDALASALSMPIEGVESRLSSAGRYRAVRLLAVVVSAEELRRGWAALRLVEGVRILI